MDTELELLIVKVGMTPAEVLRAATVIRRAYGGFGKDLGSIEAGRLANMVVLRKNPLENIANVRSVVMVVKHGIRYLHSDYKPVTAEYWLVAVRETLIKVYRHSRPLRSPRYLLGLLRSTAL